MSFSQFDLSALVNAKIRRIRPPMLKLYTIIATWFYVGLIGIAPGTFGSLATYPIYYILIQYTCHDYVCMQKYFIIITAGLVIIGWWAINAYQKHTNTFDHSSVVIDEVIGMLVAFALSFKFAYKFCVSYATYVGLSSITATFLLIFIIFRYFDIRKTFPINIIDEHLPNPFGVILDDVLAGVYTAGIVYLLYRIFV
jgi:phosphatidylglycerophosphatase A